MLLFALARAIYSSIAYNETSRTFTLQTKTSTYQMYVGHLDYLIHLYYGARVTGTDLDHLVQLRDRDFDGNPYEDFNKSRIFSLDWVLQEYPTYGGGDYRTVCLELTNTDGTSSVDLRYKSHRILHDQPKPKIDGLPQVQSDSVDTLEITLIDRFSNVTVLLRYSVFEEYDAITRSATIENWSPGPIYLTRALSASLELQDSDYDIITLDGNSQTEMRMTRSPLRSGKIIVDSIRGGTSHRHNSFVIIGSKGVDEDHGTAYGMTLLYSGNHVTEAEVDAALQTRVTMGINPRQFRWHLERNESFQTPEIVFTFSGNGLGELSRKQHRLFLNNLVRSSWKRKTRPILINNWEATYFNFDDDKLYSIAEEAKKLGIEMLVMDDGWFGHRDDDHSSLGDWWVNKNKIKRGLPQLVSDVNALGMAFGIWFEPEMISEDSDLYSAHPDWALIIPGRKPIVSRDQLVLDMTREDVRDYLFNAISDILSSANITYLKWDMNRHLTDLYSAFLPAERQGEIFHRYVLGLYELLERLTTAFPNLLLEGCSGGGGRFDAGMLYYAPQSWLSDDTDAVERLKIQFGASFAYPTSSFGSHVSVVPNHQVGRVTPLKTRGIVAMSGSFGYELDITKMSEEDKQLVPQQCADFHKYYDVIHYGDLYRLVSPYDNEYYCAWMFVSEDGSQALLNVVQIRARPIAPLVIIKLRGLDPDASYTITRYAGRVFTGSALMNAGIGMEFANGDAVAWQYEIHRL